MILNSGSFIGFITLDIVSNVSFTWYEVQCSDSKRLLMRSIDDRTNLNWSYEILKYYISNNLVIFAKDEQEKLFYELKYSK